jgi:hypothetical protein
MHLGPPLMDARAKGFDWGESKTAVPREVYGTELTPAAGLYSVFSSREALDKYAVSEAHVKVVTENIRPNIDGE